jgi:hypothetical protein
MLCDGRDLAKLHGLDMSDALQLLTVRDGTYSGPARQGGVQPITRPDSGWATPPTRRRLASSFGLKTGVYVWR